MPKKKRGSGLTRSVKYARLPRANSVAQARLESAIDTPTTLSTIDPTGHPERTTSALISDDTVRPQAGPQPAITHEQRRNAWVVYYVDTLGSPPRSEWFSYAGTIHTIMAAFNVPKGSRMSVVSALSNYHAAQESGLAYSAKSKPAGGQNRIIQHKSAESQLIADCTEMGWSLTQTTHMVNEYRSGHDDIHVGRSAVYTAYLRLNPLVSVMSKSKQGNNDVNSPWAVARLAWARQLGLRLGVWSWSSDLGAAPPALDVANLTPLALPQIVVWDETHKEVKIGKFGAGGSKRQVRFLRDDDGLVDPVNGQYAATGTYLNVKYPGQSRFAFGCAIVETSTGQEGRRCSPFIYSGKWIRTMEEYRHLQNQEIERVKNLSGDAAPWVVRHLSTAEEFYDDDKISILQSVGKSTEEKLYLLGIYTIGDMKSQSQEKLHCIATENHGFTLQRIQQIHALSLASRGEMPFDRTVDHRKAANPYQSLYGTKWVQYIENCTSMRTHVCVSKLIGHIIEASADCMRGTAFENTWVFMHDALSQMTCKSTIDWMKTAGIYHRWVLPEMGLNAGTVFAGRPIGNSPEFMPWDSSLNKDVDDAFQRHRQLTIALPDDSPYKFCSSTPNRLDSAYRRLMDPSHGVLGGSPTSDRIQQDISKCLTTHVLAVIDAAGAVVQGLGSRTGVRHIPGGPRGGKRTKSTKPDSEWIHDHAMVARTTVLDAAIVRFKSRSLDSTVV